MTGQFPLPLSAYEDEHLSTIWAVLHHRCTVEPLNVLATVIFFCAIVHMCSASWFRRVASRREETQHLEWLSSAKKEGEEKRPLRFSTVVLHYLGEFEAVFGVWVVPLLGSITLVKGWEPTKAVLESSAHFNEVVFVVVVMAIASSQPVLYLAERALSFVAKTAGGGPAAWWVSILTIGPLFGSFITEPAAMTICALLLGQHFYRYRPSTVLSYATIGLLFSNISVGGVLTDFAAPPVVMVASSWGWSTAYVFTTFGWKAIGGVCFSTLGYFYLFRREFRVLRERVTTYESNHPVLEKPTPSLVTLGNLGFLAWSVANARSPVLVIGGFLFFLAFVDATRQFQRSISLRTPLMVGFFLGGLVVHGIYQAWWIEPILLRLSEGALLLSSVALSVVNDNAAITYLASMVPHFPDTSRYVLVSGAIAAGGVTVLANAPNPAGNALLSRYFEGGISQMGLFLAAFFPLVVHLMFFVTYR